VRSQRPSAEVKGTRFFACSSQTLYREEEPRTLVSEEKGDRVCLPSGRLRCLTGIMLLFGVGAGIATSNRRRPK